MAESLALNKKLQSKFAKKVKKAKERAKVSADGIQNTTTKRKPEHGLVYIGHLPHGFYEPEITAYFKQFGKVSHVRVCRSRATGRSKGYGFVEFVDANVAKIAAETMDNYLMFNRRLIAKVVPNSKWLRHQYKCPAWSEKSYPLKKIRENVNKIKNKNWSESEHLTKRTQMVSRINRRLNKLKELGIDYSFKPVDDV